MQWTQNCSASEYQTWLKTNIFGSMIMFAIKTSQERCVSGYFRILQCSRSAKYENNTANLYPQKKAESEITPDTSYFVLRARVKSGNDADNIEQWRDANALVSDSNCGGVCSGGGSWIKFHHRECRMMVNQHWPTTRKSQMGNPGHLIGHLSQPNASLWLLVPNPKF